MMRGRAIRAGVCLCALMCLLTVMGGSAFAQEKPILRVGILPVVEELPVVVAKKEAASQLRESEVYIEVFQSWTALEAAFRTGMVDLAGMSLVKALGMAYEGIPLQILLRLHTDGSALVLACDDSPEALKGKVIGVTGNDTGQLILLDEYLKKKNLVLGYDVRFMTIPLRSSLALLKAEKIDGFLFPEPYGTIAEAQMVVKHYISGNSIMPDYMDVVLIASPSVIKRYPSAVRELVQSIRTAGVFIEKDKDNNSTQVAILQQDIMEVPNNIMQAALRKQASTLKFDNNNVNKADLQRIMKIALGLEMIGGSVDVDKLIVK